MVSEENRVRSNSSNAARTRRSAPRLPCGASGAHEILQSRDDMMQLMSRGEKSLARNGGQRLQEHGLRALRDTTGAMVTALSLCVWLCAGLVAQDRVG